MLKKKFNRSVWVKPIYSVVQRLESPMLQAFDAEQRPNGAGIALIGSFYDAPSMSHLYAAPYDFSLRVDAQRQTY